MKFFILLLSFLFFGFVPSNDSVIEADFIKSLNQSDTTFLNPVKVDSFTGNFVMQSSGSKELEESATTNTELGFLSGVTSSIQTQLDGKESTLPWLATGDLIFYNGINTTRLAAGTTNYVLKMHASGVPNWAEAPNPSPTTAEGDISINNGGGNGNDIALHIGTIGQILVSTGTTLQYQDPPSTSPTTTLGDIIVRGASEDERLAIGTANQLLTSNGTTSTWEDAPVSTTLTTKGDIQTYDTANARLAVGVDGSFLVADSTQATGLGYSTSLQGTLNSISDWEDCTIVGSWANTTYTCKEKRIGDEIKFSVGMTVNGAVSGALEFTLPNSYIIDTSKINQAVDDATIVGSEVLINDASGGNYKGIIAYDTTTTVAVKSINSSSTYAQINTVGNTSPYVWAVGDTLTASFTLPIVGLTNGLDAVVESKTLDATTANALNARINSTAVVSNEDFDFLDGNCTLAGTGDYDCVYKSGIFTEEPVVTCTVDNAAQGSCSTIGGSSGGFTIRTIRVDTGNATSYSLGLHVAKQGADVNKDTIQAATILRTAYLKDVKATTVDGGTFTSGSLQTRTLNTIEGDTSIVSLSANQFTLQSGTYEIDVRAPVRRVNRHQAVLYNISDSQVTLVGGSALDETGSGGQDARIVGVFTIASAKTFEIQHQCETTSATFGFGNATDFGLDEIYTVVKITKR